jgi:hypothetical protein
MGVLEYWNIGVMELEVPATHPTFHRSTIPAFQVIFLNEWRT